MEPQIYKTGYSAKDSLWIANGYIWRKKKSGNTNVAPTRSGPHWERLEKVTDKPVTAPVTNPTPKPEPAPAPAPTAPPAAPVPQPEPVPAPAPTPTPEVKPTPAPTGQIALPEPKFNAAPVGYIYPYGSEDAPKTTTGTVIPGKLPVIHSVTKEARPDDNIVIGGSLKGVSRVVMWQKGRNTTVDAVIKIKGDFFMTVLVPETLKYEVIAVWVINDAGASNALLVNHTEAWWPQTRIVAGQPGMLFGQNLTLGNATGKTQTFVTLVPKDGGIPLKAEVTAANPNRIDYIVPTSVVPTKEYHAYVHNGMGGKYSMSSPLYLKADYEIKYTGPTFAFDNYKQATDISDSEALVRAVEAVNNTNGTLQMPLRTLELHRKTKIYGQNFRIVGPGKSVCKVQAKAGFAEGDMIVSSLPLNKVHISGITFSNNKILMGGKGMWFGHSKNVTWEDCAFDFPGVNPFHAHDSTNVMFRRCEFIGKNTFVGTSLEVFFEDCRHLVTDDAGEPIHSYGSNGISINNGYCADYDNTKLNGWGKGRFYVGNNGTGSSRNQYIGLPKTNKLEVRRGVWDPAQNKHVGGPDPNSGEQILWEGPLCHGDGYAINPNANYTSFELGTLNVKMGAAMVAIIDGKGQGQFKPVKSQEMIEEKQADGSVKILPGKRITIEGEWMETPDQTSYFVVGHFTYNIAVYQGNLSGKRNDPNFVTAGSGVQLYGGAMNFVVDGYVGDGLRYGVTNCTTHHQKVEFNGHGGKPGLEPNLFGIFKNIKLIDPAYSLRQDLMLPASGKIRETACMIGITFRNIDFGKPRAKTQYLVGTMDVPNSSRHMVIEHCVVDKLPLEQEGKAGFATTLYHKLRTLTP